MMEIISDPVAEKNFIPVSKIVISHHGTRDVVASLAKVSGASSPKLLMNSSPASPGSLPGILETMTIEQVRDFNPEVVVIPIGSTEPHGPHLPYGTDLFIAEAVTGEAVRLANAENARVLRLPALPISNNVNFKKFPFACRIRVETLMALLKDLVDFVCEEGVRKIVIVNCHGGNDAILASLRQSYDQHQNRAFVCLCHSCSFSDGAYDGFFNDGSPHAGDFETSMIYAIKPELIVENKLKPSKMNQPAISRLGKPGVDWVRPWHVLMSESYSGNPELASSEKGRQFLDICAAGMAKFLIELSREPWHEQFPYPPQSGGNI